MTALRRILVTGAFGLLSLSAIPAAALPITDLFNTGVLTDDNDGMSAVLLAPGTPDPHYILTASPTLGDFSTSLTEHFVWLTNGPHSNWIGSVASLGAGITDVAPGVYIYGSTFTLPPAANLSSVEITFLAASDNSLTDLMLNGLSTGITQSGFGLLNGPFTIDSSNGTFVAGVNTLTWTTFNEPIATPSGFNPHGFRVDQIKGTYEIVPEPCSPLLVGVCFLSLLLRRQRG